jgi:hypothetical protein
MAAAVTATVAVGVAAATAPRIAAAVTATVWDGVAAPVVPRDADDDTVTTTDGAASDVVEAVPAGPRDTNAGFGVPLPNVE